MEINMIKFNEQEKEILRNEIQDTFNAMTISLVDDFEDMSLDEESNDMSIYYTLSMSYYLLSNIDKLYDDKVYQLILQKYFINDIWNAVDEEVQNKVYTKDENELFNKIISYKW
jgi:hypothetical protein